MTTNLLTIILTEKWGTSSFAESLVWTIELRAIGHERGLAS
ncbi:hypothetical protein [Pseudomonas asiatica]|nr:hypothetical protein [Pseudomonas asiatica]